MSNDDEVFYFNDEKSAGVYAGDKKQCKVVEPVKVCLDSSSLSHRRNKEANTNSDKVKSKKDKRGTDSERIKKKSDDINAKKNSKHVDTPREINTDVRGDMDTNKFSLVKIQIETCSHFVDKNVSSSVTDTKHNANYKSVETGADNDTIMRNVTQNCKTTNTDNTSMAYKEKGCKISSKNCSSANRNSEKRDKSPFKKLSRSSLTIEPDKITVNLSKYSPCASRLAASSKILSTTSPTSPDSPLRAVRSRSPSNFGNGSRLASRDSGIEKSTIQASLSLNIHQFQKSNSSTPRSKSVGDSCVTSPTSEGTTTSCSPTGTEILSLDEVGHINSFTPTDESGDNFTRIGHLVGGDILSNSSTTKCKQKTRKTTLETKC